MLTRDMDKGATVDNLLTQFNSAPVATTPRLNGIRSRVVRLCGLGMVLAGGFGLTGCHSGVTNGRAPSYLVIDSLLGGAATKAGAAPTFVSLLQSDVETNKSVFEDPGQVTLHTELKDVTVTSPTANNLITVNHYRVQFRRTDGHNVQGVDVPYAFEGAVTFTVGPGGVTHGFTLVRVQSKLEPPLINLVGGGGSIVISTIADVTFYGQDQTGTDVSITGSISVNFADWGDPTS
jgi:hypothetical protein